MSNVTSLLRLSFGELLLVETLLTMAVDSAPPGSKSRRLKLIQDLRDKIKAALTDAESKGLIDMAGLDRELGLGLGRSRPT